MNLPDNELLYVGIKNGASQWQQIDHALTGYAASLFGNASENPARLVESLISLYFRVRPADVENLGGGEQAWFFGDSVGVALRPSNPADAISTARAMTRRSFPYSGVTMTQGGHAVRILQSSLAHHVRFGGPSPALLVNRSEVSRPVSLIIAADLAPLNSAGAGRNGPSQSIDGVVITLAPEGDGRYGLRLYADISR